MSIHSKQLAPLAARVLLALVLCLFLVAHAAMAQITITNVTAANVTPDSFSIIGAVSKSTPLTNITVSVFADPNGVTNLAGQVGIELYPLNTGNPASTNSWQTLLGKTALSQESMALGLVYVRVCYCAPNTKYYYQVTVSGTNGQAIWPVSGPLPAVTTALANSFVLDSQQLLLTLNDGSPPGSIIVLSNTNGATVLAAVVGDGAPTNQVFFNLSDLISASGGTNLTAAGSQSFTARLLTSARSSFSQPYTVVYSNTFTTGLPTLVPFGTLYTTVTLGTNAVLAGTSGNVPIMVSSESALGNITFNLNLPTNLFTSISVVGTSPVVNSATLQTLSSNQVQLAFIAANGFNLLGNQQIAQLNFTAASNDSSAFVQVHPQSITATNPNPATTISFLANQGEIVIVGPKSLLQASIDGSGMRNLALYGIPWASFEIQYTTNLAKPNGWQNLMRVPMTNIVATFSGLNMNLPSVFYRAYQFSANPPIIEAHLANNLSRSLLAYGQPGTNYMIQYATNDAGTVSWYPLTSYTMTNAFQYFNNIGGNANPMIFYRIKKP
jgi:hypothetical protein